MKKEYIPLDIELIQLLESLIRTSYENDNYDDEDWNDGNTRPINP